MQIEKKRNHKKLLYIFGITRKYTLIFFMCLNVIPKNKFKT